MKQCGECQYLKTSIVVDGQCPCVEKDEYRFANDYYAETCDSFFRVGWGYRSEAMKAIADADRYVKEHTNSGPCFITTAIVHILGMGDTCEELQTLRVFRKNILQKDDKYRDLLLRYDAVGPVLARALACDEDRVQIAIDLFQIYIKGCVRYLKAGRVDDAIVLYTEMVERMISKYMLRREFIPEVARDSYVQDCGGHGILHFKQV